MLSEQSSSCWHCVSKVSGFLKSFGAFLKSFGAAAAATAAAAEADTEASTTILPVNILYLRACASALTCRDRAADPAGMPPDTTPGPDVVGMDSAAQGLGCGAISLCDWWLIPGHYNILPNRLYLLLGADVIGSAGEDEWYSLTAALRWITIITFADSIYFLPRRVKTVKTWRIPQEVCMIDVV